MGQDPGLQNSPRAEMIHLPYTAPTVFTVMRPVRLPICTLRAPLGLPIHVANKYILRIEKLQPWWVRVIVGPCNDARGLQVRGCASIIFGTANATLVRAGLTLRPVLLSFSQCSRSERNVGGFEDGNVH